MARTIHSSIEEEDRPHFHDVRLHFRPREMAVIRLAAQCAYQLGDTDEFMKHAIILQQQS